MRTFGLIAGALTILWGVAAFAMPVGTFLGVGWILGLLLLLTGVLLVVIGFKGKDKSIKTGLIGILITVLGGMIFLGAASNILSNIKLIYIISACIVLFGAIAIYVGCKIFEKSKGKGILVVVCAVVAVILGGLLLIKPTIAMAFIGYVIAIALILYGIGIIILSLKIGKKDKDEEKENKEDEKPAE